MATDHGLERHDDMSGGQHHVIRQFVRLRRMAAAALYRDVDFFRGGHEHSTSHPDGACRKRRPDVLCKGGLRCGCV